MNRIEVVSDDQGALPEDARRAVRSICRRALAAEGCDGLVLSVLIASPQTSRELNQQWRGGDYTANVLSFPGTGAPLTPRSRLRHLGDLAVCPAVAAQEAAGSVVSKEYRLAHLLIHGILHLLGYDHVDDPAQARRMERREEALLDMLDRRTIQGLAPLFAVSFGDGPNVT